VRTTSKSAFYADVVRRKDWDFSELTRSETTERTHAYHKYPAKFIPQLARALISEYSVSDSLIWDPFCGSGTLNTEALRTGRASIGTDINPVAVLISRVKSTVCEPVGMDQYVSDLLDSIQSSRVKGQEFYISEGVLNGNLPILKRWFSSYSLRQLGHILWSIKQLPARRAHRQFALCSFSSILKRSSSWLNTSVKAQVDPHKNPSRPIFYLKRQLHAMKAANRALFEEMGQDKTSVRIFTHDARHLLPQGIRGQVDLIVTSPPYLVSYDYSDIFRLSSYFLYYRNDYTCFRTTFIGTTLRKRNIDSWEGCEQVADLVGGLSDTDIRWKLYQYYDDMTSFLDSAKRNLKPKGYMVLVIGDTELRGTKIPNTFLVARLAEDLGWKVVAGYERRIPAKILPTFRDKDTGKFTGRQNGNHSKRYAREFVIVLRKGER